MSLFSDMYDVRMIYLGADHGGYELKERVKSWLSDHGYIYEDMGNTQYDAEDDYPQYAFAVAGKVSRHVSSMQEVAGSRDVWSDQSKGILMCRSAGGVVIAANKVRGIRAVAVIDEKMTIHAREHNDANIIALSGDWTKEEDVEKILSAFLDTPCSKEIRHLRRIEKISAFEKRNT